MICSYGKCLTNGFYHCCLDCKLKDHCDDCCDSINSSAFKCLERINYEERRLKIIKILEK